MSVDRRRVEPNSADAPGGAEATPCPGRAAAAGTATGQAEATGPAPTGVAPLRRGPQQAFPLVLTPAPRLAGISPHSQARRLVDAASGTSATEG